MANVKPSGYATKWRFTFVSQNGTDYRIDIRKKSYSQGINYRNLASAPVLRRENNENVSGTSLDLKIECTIDGEFRELYTSKADEYLVYVERMSGNTATLIWAGFVCPELYSEPDIAPPYDISVTAVDGLGELKRYNFEKVGNRSLYYHISTLLEKTALVSSEIRLISDISANNINAASLLGGVYVDLDFMHGETCYDVIQYILKTLNATLTQHNGYWLLVRENSVKNRLSSGNVVVNTTSGATTYNYPRVRFGTMASYSWWPVGQMSSEVIPAKKAVELTMDYHYADTFLPCSYMETDGWRKSSTGVTYYSTDHAYRLDDGDTAYIEQSVAVANPMTALRLDIDLAKYGGMVGKPKSVKIWVHFISDDQSAHLFLKDGDNNETQWAEVSTGLVRQFTAMVTGSRINTDTISIAVPRLYADIPGTYWVQIQAQPSSETTYTLVTRAVLYCDAQYKGRKDILNISNDARDSEVVSGIGFGPYGGDMADFNTILFQGIAKDVSGNGIYRWHDGWYSSSEYHDYLYYIARDYARSVGLPRIRKTGKLNVPANSDMPVLFYDGNKNYWPITFGWNLLEDEMDVDMRSLSDVSAIVSVGHEEIVEVPGEGSASHGSSGGGGGGGDTPTTTYTGASGEISVNGMVIGLADAGTAGTYTKVTTDAKGRVVSGTNPTSLPGLGISIDSAPTPQSQNPVTSGGVSAAIATINTSLAQKTELAIFGSGSTLSEVTTAYNAGKVCVYRDSSGDNYTLSSINGNGASFASVSSTGNVMRGVDIFANGTHRRYETDTNMIRYVEEDDFELSDLIYLRDNGYLLVCRWNGYDYNLVFSDNNRFEFVYVTGFSWWKATCTENGWTYTQGNFQQEVIGGSGNFAGFDSDIELADSGYGPDDFIKAQENSPQDIHDEWGIVNRAGSGFAVAQSAAQVNSAHSHLEVDEDVEVLANDDLSLVAGTDIYIYTHRGDITVEADHEINLSARGVKISGSYLGGAAFKDTQSALADNGNLPTGAAVVAALAGKVGKAHQATAGNIALFDSNGDLQDQGVSIATGMGQTGYVLPTAALAKAYTDNQVADCVQRVNLTRGEVIVADGAGGFRGTGNDIDDYAMVDDLDELRPLEVELSESGGVWSCSKTAAEMLAAANDGRDVRMRYFDGSSRPVRNYLFTLQKYTTNQLTFLSIHTENATSLDAMMVVVTDGGIGQSDSVSVSDRKISLIA